MSKTKQKNFLIPIHISFYVLPMILTYRSLKLVNMVKGARAKSEQKTDVIYAN
jgi:hypothetical protein